MTIVIKQTNVNMLDKLFKSTMIDDGGGRFDIDEHIKKHTVIVFDDIYSPNFGDEPVIFTMSREYYFSGIHGGISVGPIIKDIDVEDLAKLLTQQMDLFKYHNDPESLHGYKEYQDKLKNAGKDL